MDWYVVLAIIVGAIILVVLVLMAWYFSYINPCPTGKIDDNISVIRTGIANCFVYSKDSAKIIIDLGTSAKKLLDGFTELDIDSKSIKHVFITHHGICMAGLAPIN